MRRTKANAVGWILTILDADANEAWNRPIFVEGVQLVRVLEVHVD